MQRPDATDVRSYNAWRELGRQVKGKGTGIAILAPAGSRDADEEAGTKARMFFKIVHVFDISNTVPADA